MEILLKDRDLVGQFSSGSTISEGLETDTQRRWWFFHLYNGTLPESAKAKLNIQYVPNPTIQEKLTNQAFATKQADDAKAFLQANGYHGKKFSAANHTAWQKAGEGEIAGGSSDGQKLIDYAKTQSDLMKPAGAELLKSQPQYKMTKEELGLVQDWKNGEIEGNDPVQMKAAVDKFNAWEDATAKDVAAKHLIAGLQAKQDALTVKNAEAENAAKDWLKANPGQYKASVFSKDKFLYKAPEGANEAYSKYLSGDESQAGMAKEAVKNNYTFQTTKNKVLDANPDLKLSAKEETYVNNWKAGKEPPEGEAEAMKTAVDKYQKADDLAAQYHITDAKTAKIAHDQYVADAKVAQQSKPPWMVHYPSPKAQTAFAKFSAGETLTGGDKIAMSAYFKGYAQKTGLSIEDTKTKILEGGLGFKPANTSSAYLSSLPKDATNQPGSLNNLVEPKVTHPLDNASSKGLLYDAKDPAIKDAVSKWYNKEEMTDTEKKSFSSYVKMNSTTEDANDKSVKTKIFDVMKAGVKSASPDYTPSVSSPTVSSVIKQDDFMPYKDAVDSAGKPSTATKTINTLSDDHIAGLSNDQKSAMKAYTNGMYGDINNSLRGAKTKGLPALGGGQTPGYIANLDAAIDKSTLDKPMVVYRGIRYEPKDLHVGGTIHDYGYMSTSTKDQFASDWSGGENPSVLRIHMDKGTKALAAGHNSSHPSENELILPRNSVLTVHKITDVDFGHGKKGKLIDLVYTGRADYP